MAVAIETSNSTTPTTTTTTTTAPVKKGGRGLSFDEKRRRLSEYFLEKKDFFQLKDLEKLVPKATGIVTQSVKEVLQSLVDDRLVNAEKIGTSNYFWSFPSTAMQTRQNMRNNLKEELARLKEMREKCENQLREATLLRQESGERDELLEKYTKLEKIRSEAAAKLEIHRSNDPKLLAQKRQDALKAKISANRWTDNIFTLQSYCANNFSIERAQFNEQFAIPEDFDYI